MMIKLKQSMGETKRCCVGSKENDVFVVDGWIVGVRMKLKVVLIWIVLKSMSKDEYFEQLGHASRIQRYSE